MTTAPDPRNHGVARRQEEHQLPTRTSVAIVLLGTVGLVAVLLGRVGPALVPALVGIGGALSLAGGFWAVSSERFRTVGQVAGGLLAFPVGVGFVVGTVGTALVLVEVYFPVPDAGLIAVNALLLVSRLGIVVGCVLATLGAVLGIRSVVDPATLSRYYWTVLRTGTVPLAVTATAAGGAVLSELRPGAAGVTPAGVAAGLLGWLAAPGPGLHVASFFLAVSVAAMAVRAAVDSLPVAELVADSGAGEPGARRVRTVRQWLLYAGVATLGLALAGLYVDVQFRTPARLAAAVGPGIAAPLAGLTGAAVLRAPLVAVGLAAAVAVSVTWALRRVARMSLTAAARRAGPVLVGGVLALGALALAGPAFDRLVAAVAGRLPSVFATEFREVAGSVEVFYGPGTVVLGAMTACLVVAGLLVLAARLLLWLGYLSRRRAGFALASAGLFLATVFAGTLETPAPLVFGGLVVSLLVWDAGEYGTTLGEEVGRRARTRSGELVHVGATLAVGLAGAGAALAARALLASRSVDPSPAVTAGLVAALAGALLLVAALR
ncbi:DUF7519 family protein [Salinirussus salinus]|uniref:DUF7519 family protein n=1 Tax=Salinirussus salinus TaxID=1198300 RepID=UPI00135875FB|nr:hypothetical protein [Salinirussus salinus]